MNRLMDTRQDQFEPTRWSLVLRSREEDSSTRIQALEALCRAYWYPLYAFLRRAGRSRADAEDLVQEFFLRLLDGRLLAVAEPAKGKFRTLLLAALKRLDADAHKAMQAVKRGGRMQFIPLDSLEAEERWQMEASTAQSPEAAFERAWAAAAMERAGQRLQKEHAGTKAPLFAELSPFLTGCGEGGLAAVAARVSMSEVAVRTALKRLRRRYADALRAEIADTVGSRGDVQDELRYLLTVLSQDSLN